MHFGSLLGCGMLMIFLRVHFLEVLFHANQSPHLHFLNACCILLWVPKTPSHAWKLEFHNTPIPLSLRGLERGTGKLSGSLQHGYFSLTYEFPGDSVVKKLPAMQETQVQSLGQEHPQEKEMVNYSSILAWEIPWTEEPGGLQSMGSQKSLTGLSNLTILFP